MSGLRIKLLVYMLMVSAVIITPLILLTLPTYNEIAGHYRAIMTAQDTLTLSEIRNILQTGGLYLSRLVTLYITSLLVLILSGVYLVNRLVIKPVHTLTNATNQLAQGNYGIQIPTNQHNEIGTLAESFRTLRTYLQTTMQRQEQESDDLNQILIALQESEQRTKEIFNNAQDGLIMTDDLGKIEAVNPALCEMTGYQENEILGHNVEILIPKSQRPKHQQKIVNFVLDKDRQKRDYMQLEALHKNGTTIPIELSLSQISSNNKHNIVAVMHDVSERIKAEQALRKERDRAQSYLDTAEVAIISIDTSGRITLVNRKCCELLGYSEHELLGMDYFKLCPDQEVTEELREAYTLHVTKNDAFPKYFYINLQTKDGQTRNFEWYNNTIKDFEWNTVGIILAGTDMTEFRKSIDERKALRERLHQSRKMEAIGQLSSGIAHDFNNLLATMMGYTELLQEMLPDNDDDSIQNYLQEIYISGERARDLIEGILKYSRSAKKDGSHSAENLYLPGIVNHLSNMLQGILPANIELSMDLGQDAHTVIIDSLNLQQIIMNLCLNASDAMQAGGNLMINTRNTDNYHGSCSSCGKSFDGNFLELSFSDTGCGIEAEAITNLFEPFFTTKVVGEVGKGAGMGLAVVHGLVHEANGHIIVESKAGVGSTFRVMLPAAMAHPATLSAHG